MQILALSERETPTTAWGRDPPTGFPPADAAALPALHLHEKSNLNSFSLSAAAGNVACVGILHNLCSAVKT